VSCVAPKGFFANQFKTLEMRSIVLAACAGLAASQADPTLITDLPGYSGNSVMRSGYISVYRGCAFLDVRDQD